MHILNIIFIIFCILLGVSRGMKKIEQTRKGSLANFRQTNNTITYFTEIL